MGREVDQRRGNVFQRSRRSRQDAIEVLRLADRASQRMRAQNLAAGCVQVKIRRADFTTFTRQKRFEPSTTDSRTIAKIAAELLGPGSASSLGPRSGC
jgi:DNA polymerase-4